MQYTPLPPTKALPVLLALLLALLLTLSLPAHAAQAAPAGGEESRNSMFEREVDTIVLGRSADHQKEADLRGDGVANAPTQAEKYQPAAAGAAPERPWQQVPFNRQTGQGQMPPQETQQQTAQEQTAQALPGVPLGDLSESNAELTLGTSLPKGSVWQLNRFAAGDGPRQIYKLSPSAAITVHMDPASRRAVKISIAVVHVPSIYGPAAKATFENECLTAVLFGGNLFVEMERNPGLAQAMQNNLSLQNAALLQGRIVDFGLAEAPIRYSARLEGGRYTLDITAKN